MTGQKKYNGILKNHGAATIGIPEEERNRRNISNNHD
jgi:hypothetical protein